MKDVERETGNADWDLVPSDTRTEIGALVLGSKP